MSNSGTHFVRVLYYHVFFHFSHPDCNGEVEVCGEVLLLSMIVCLLESVVWRDENGVSPEFRVCLTIDFELFSL